MNNFLWYLASPYVDEYSIIMFTRYLSVSKAAAVLTEQDLMVFPPITLGHNMCERQPSLKDWDQEKWRKWSASFMSRCDGLLVHMQDNWAESTGVNEEINYFMDGVQKPIAYLGADFWSDPVELERTLLRIEYAKEMIEDE